MATINHNQYLTNLRTKLRSKRAQLANRIRKINQQLGDKVAKARPTKPNS